VTAKKAKGSSKVLTAVFGVVGVMVGVLLSAGILFFATDGFQFTAVTQILQAQSGPNITVNPVAEDSSVPVAVAAKVLPSIVNIDVYVEASGYSSRYNDSGSGSDNLEEYGLGSGVVLTEDGYILTNYHVIENGVKFLVRFNQDIQLEATVVDYDVSSDLAVIKVNAKGLIPIEVADSSKVLVGEWVMALGSPFGLEKSVSTGIVSALFRSTTMESTNGVNIYANMIQTDAAINPGNSGGALVNAEGKLIGINTLINSASGSSSGVGFAIPSNYALNIANQILAGKTVAHAWLGVTVVTVDKTTMKSLNVTVDHGAYVDSVVPGSPADLAGVKAGDVITKFESQLVSTNAELIINVRGHLVSDKVDLVVYRNGQEQTLHATLGSDTDSPSR
jgi:putative serine protease PepD